MSSLKEINNSENPKDYYNEKLPDVFGSLKNTARKSCGVSLLRNTIPIIKWLPNYKKKYFVADLVAGITVGLTCIPQGIAYAVVAGLSPEYGLYSAFMGCFVYIFLGTCKDITIGPTAIMALLTNKYVTESPDFAVLLCFLAGCIITLFGILQLGFVVRFISTPVTLGFTTAAAITIGSGQINPLLGIPNSSSEFIESWGTFFKHINKVQLWDSILGVTTLVCILLLRKCNSLRGKWKVCGKYMSLSRNALAVIIGTLIAFVFDTYNMKPFRLTGQVKSGLPPFQPPPFSSTTKNGEDIDFINMVKMLGPSLIAIPLLSILESIAIAKAFSKGRSIDASQEMLAVGISNIFSAFVSSMPVTGSFTRTAINNNSGVCTTLGGLYTGLLVLLALGFLSDAFQYIPKTVLAAIIISAMIFMVHPDRAYKIWKSKKADLIPYFVTLIACLVLGLEIGIVCGIIVNVLYVLYLTAQPEITYEEKMVNGSEVIIIKPNQSLIYSSAEYIEKIILRKVTNLATISQKYVLLDGKSIATIDSTVAASLVTMCSDLKLLNCTLIFWNWNIHSEGVLWRLKNNISKNFEHTEQIENIIKHHYVESATTLSELSLE